MSKPLRILAALALCGLSAGCEKTSAWPPETTAGLYQVAYASAARNSPAAGDRAFRDAKEPLDMLATVLAVAASPATEGYDCEEDQKDRNAKYRPWLSRADQLRLAEIAVAYTAAALVDNRGDAFRAETILNQVSTMLLGRAEKDPITALCEAKNTVPEEKVIRAKVCLAGMLRHTEGMYGRVLELTQLRREALRGAIDIDNPEFPEMSEITKVKPVLRKALQNGNNPDDPTYLAPEHLIGVLGREISRRTAWVGGVLDFKIEPEYFLDCNADHDLNELVARHANLRENYCAYGEWSSKYECIDQIDPVKISKLKKIRCDIARTVNGDVFSPPPIKHYYTLKEQHWKHASEAMSTLNIAYLNNHNCGSNDVYCARTGIEVYLDIQTNPKTDSDAEIMNNVYLGGLWYDGFIQDVTKLFGKMSGSDLDYLSELFRSELTRRERSLNKCNRAKIDEANRRWRIDRHLDGLPNHRAFQRVAGDTRFLHNLETITADETEAFVVVASDDVMASSVWELMKALRDVGFRPKLFKLSGVARGYTDSEVVTWQGLSDRIKEIGRAGTPVRQLLLAWAGHGGYNQLAIPPEAGDAAQGGCNGHTSIPFRCLHDTVSRAKVNRALLIVDACHSGTAAYSAVRERSAAEDGPAIAGITAEADRFRLVFGGSSLFSKISKLIENRVETNVGFTHRDLYEDLQENYENTLETHHLSRDIFLEAAPGLYHVVPGNQTRFYNQAFQFPAKAKEKSQ